MRSEKRLEVLTFKDFIDTFKELGSRQGSLNQGSHRPSVNDTVHDFPRVIQSRSKTFYIYN